MTDPRTVKPVASIGVLEAVRFLCEIFAVVSLAVWGFSRWSLPWNIVFGIGLPLVAILLWGLFRSPKAVFRVDAFVKALVEIVVMTAAAFAWWDMGQHLLAGIFAVIALATGLFSGRKELA